MSEPAARRIFQQLASALDWAHRAGVAIGDVKCDNVLLDGPGAEVRMAHFGWSCAAAADGRCGGRLRGTPEYIAPEVRAPHFAQFASALDTVYGKAAICCLHCVQGTLAFGVFALQPGLAETGGNLVL